MSTLKVRDPIHGFIDFTPLEEAVIDCPAFQRLRSVRQLALAHYVYPSANHTRFEHSLGVMHLAGRMADHFELSPEIRENVRLAGLVHDIGHGPFGHVSEEVFEALGTSLPSNDEIYKIHEHISNRIIRSPKHLAECLGDRATHIADILNPKANRSIEKDIVSGAIDADKIDYLIRDSYFCGVKYGIFDAERLIRVLTRENDTSKEIMIASHGIESLEQFVVAKYFMNTQVYRHRIRLITDAMLTRATLLAYEKNVYLQSIYNYDSTSEDYLDEYLLSNDTRLMEEGSQCPSEGADLFKMIKGRKLLKCVFHCRADEIGTRASLAIKKQVKDPNRVASAKVEASVAKIFKANPSHCILKVYRLGFDAGEAGNMGEVLVLGEASEPQLLQQHSRLCKKFEDELGDIKIDVYVPCGDLDEKDRASKRSEILEIFKSFHTL